MLDIYFIQGEPGEEFILPTALDKESQNPNRENEHSPGFGLRITFAREVHGLLADGVGGAGDGDEAAEDGLGPEELLVEDLVHGDVEEAVALHGQRRRLAPLGRAEKWNGISFAFAEATFSIRVFWG